MSSLPESITPARSTDHVGSLERGLAVLELLASHPAGLTLSETAERAGLTRAGARRLLLTLAATGYAVQEGRKFRLSSRLISLSRRWLADASLWTFADPFMRAVSKTLNESCSAAILAGEDVVYVARVAGARIVRVALDVGTRLPAHCTSMGRVLLAGMPDDALAAYLEHATITRMTAHTVTGRAALRAAIEAARRDGFAVVDQELEIGLRSVAVPVRDLSGAVVAAINVSTQSARTSLDELERDVLPLLRRAAMQIEDYFVVQ